MNVTWASGVALLRAARWVLVGIGGGIASVLGGASVVFTYLSLFVSGENFGLIPVIIVGPVALFAGGALATWAAWTPRPGLAARWIPGILSTATATGLFALLTELSFSFVTWQNVALVAAAAVPGAVCAVAVAERFRAPPATPPAS